MDVHGVIGIGPLGLRLVERMKKSAASDVLLLALCEEGQENPSSTLVEPIELVRLKPVHLYEPSPDDPIAVDSASGGLRRWWKENGSPHIRRLTLRAGMMLDQRKMASPLSDLTIFVDLSSPASLLVAPFIKDTAEQWRNESTLFSVPLQWRVCLLRPGEGSPYVAPALQELLALQKTLEMPLSLYLLEDAAERPGDLEEMLGAWVEKVVSGLHAPPLSEDLNTFGLVQRSLPAWPFLRFLEARLTADALRELGEEWLPAEPFRVPELLRPVSLPAEDIPWPGGPLARPLEAREFMLQILRPGEKLDPEQEWYSLGRLSREADRLRNENFPILQKWLEEEARNREDQLLGSLYDGAGDSLQKGGIPGALKWIDDALTAVRAEIQKVDGYIQALNDPNRRSLPVYPTPVLREVLYFLCLGLAFSLLFNGLVLWPLLGGPARSWPLVILLWLPLFFIPAVLLLSALALRGRVEKMQSLRSLYPEWRGGIIGLLGEISLLVVVWRFLLSRVLGDQQWLLLVYVVWLIGLTVLWFFWPSIYRNELLLTERVLGYRLRRLFHSLESAEKGVHQEEWKIPWGRLCGRATVLLLLLTLLVIPGVALLYRSEAYHSLIAALPQAFAGLLGELLLSGNLLEALGEAIGDLFENLPWLRDGLLVSVLLLVKYPVEGLLALWRTIERGRARPLRQEAFWQTLGFTIMALGVGLYFGLRSDTGTLHRVILGAVVGVGVLYFWWNYGNDLLRVRVALEEWKELRERELWLDLHRFAWEKAREVLAFLAENLQYLHARLERLDRERLALVTRLDQEAEEAREESMTTPGFSTGFILVSDQEWNLWASRLLPALWEKETVRRWFGSLLKEEIIWLRQMISAHVHAKEVEDRVGQELNIWEYLKRHSRAQSQKEWVEFLSRWEAPPFARWLALLTDGSRPRLSALGGEPRVFLGLPPEARGEVPFQQAVGVTLAQPPSVFNEEPWTLSVIRYSLGFSAYSHQGEDRRRAEEARKKWEQGEE